MKSDATLAEAGQVLGSHRRLLVLDQATDRPIGILSCVLGILLALNLAALLTLTSQAYGCDRVGACAYQTSP